MDGCDYVTNRLRPQLIRFREGGIDVGCNKREMFHLFFMHSIYIYSVVCTGCMVDGRGADVIEGEKKNVLVEG